MPERNRQIVLKRRPNGLPVPEDFAISEGALPEPKEGEVLLRGIYLSLDPYMRGRISGVRSYAKPTGIGDVIEGRVVGQVVRSRDPAFRDGDYASGGYGWQLYSTVPAGGLLKLDPAAAPISTALGILGMPGMTAYIGLADIGQPKAGETVVISAASGAVGAVAGQLAKRAGARVVGIAGGAEKCRYVEGELGFDAAIDHRGSDLGAALDRACPGGIDVYFENVGGAVQQSGLSAPQRFRPDDHVRHDLGIQRHEPAPRPQSRRGRPQAPQDPGLYRQRSVPSPRRVPGDGGAAGEERPAQIPRGHRRRPGARSRGLYRPVAGQKFRQALGPAGR